MLAIAATLGAGPAGAEGLARRFSLRGEVGAGWMLPSVQRQTLGLDSAQVQATARVGFDVFDWLSLQASVNNGFFPAGGQRPTGRTLALQFGVRLQPALGTVGRLWGDVNPGYYSTGADRRFGLDGGVGFEFALGRVLELGPFARAHWVPADVTIHAPSDAVYLTFGLSLSLRLPRPVVVARVADGDGDGVPDADDRCVAVPRGPRPDPARRGCPDTDTGADADADRDGVLDRDDLCLSVPAGTRADPTRAGCPLEDQDGDGVPDREDRCPTQAQGPHSDPGRPGCPLSDQDGDTVADGEDHCPTRPRGARPRAAWLPRRGP